MIWLVTFILLAIDYCSGFFEICTRQGIVRRKNDQSCTVLLPTGESYPPKSSCNFDGLAYQTSKRERLFYWQSNLKNDIFYYNCNRKSSSLECSKVNLSSKLDKGQYESSYIYFLPPKDNLFMVRVAENGKTAYIFKENEANFAIHSGSINSDFISEKNGLYQIFQAEDIMKIRNLIITNNSENFIKPDIGVFNFESNTSWNAEFDSTNFKIAGGDRTFCNISDQCDTNIYLSCGSERDGPYFIVQIIIKQLSESTKNTMLTIYNSSDKIMFDNQMIGLDCFKIQYPYNTIGFVVRCDITSAKWCILFAELKNAPSVLGTDCVLTKTSQKFAQWLCPLSIRSNLEYISVGKYSLVVHTKSGGQLTKDPIPMCYLMNDCYGCRLMAETSSLKCAWKYGQCFNSILKDLPSPKDCFVIEKAELKTKPREDPIFSVTIKGIRVDNPTIRIVLKVEEKIYKSIFQDENIVNFRVRGNTLSLIHQQSEDIYLTIDSEVIKGSQVTIRIYQESRSTLLIILLIVSLIFVIAVLSLLHFRHKKRQKIIKINTARALLEKTISGVPKISRTEISVKSSSKISEIESSTKKSVLDGVKSVQTGPISKADPSTPKSRLRSVESGTDKVKPIPGPGTAKNLLRKSKLGDNKPPTSDDGVVAVKSTSIRDVKRLPRRSKLDIDVPIADVTTRKSRIDGEKYDADVEEIRSRPPSETQSEVQSQRPNIEGKSERVQAVQTAPISKFLSRDKKDES